MAVLFAGSLMATEYTYTDFATTFNRGTTKTGTDISGAISTTTTMATLAASGATNFSGVEAVANCYYNANGVGLRLAKSGGAGSLTLTLSDALKDSTISAIVVYASKVSGNAKATLDVTPAGGYTTKTSYANGDLSAYSSTDITTYKLDTIKVGGKKLTSITLECASGGYTMVHGITLVTQTEKAAEPTTKTVYCKMTYDWWTTASAAIAVHYWGGATSTTWPGIRMTEVEDNIWGYDVPADATNFCFVRVNGSGDVEDWGAKTVDLAFQTDNKNLFTITSSDAHWGE